MPHYVILSVQGYIADTNKSVVLVHDLTTHTINERQEKSRFALISLFTGNVFVVALLFCLTFSVFFVLNRGKFMLYVFMCARVSYRRL